MEGDIDGTGGAASTGSHDPRSRRRASVSGVLGEVLITVGLVVLLYVAWQMWIGDWIMGAQKTADAAELAQEWDAAASAAPTTPQASASPSPSATVEPEPPSDAEPVILPQPDDGEVFGIMYIPRLGEDYHYKVAGGVTRSGTLDHIGIGHYPGTSMPGDVGNVALAAHRTTFGAPFNRIADLHVGDAIVIRTEDGWYTYRFRTLQYVQPTAIDVLDAVPQVSSTPAGERYLTMTSCSPMHSLAERIVAYSVFESFTPIADGPPSSLAPVTGS